MSSGGPGDDLVRLGAGETRPDPVPGDRCQVAEQCAQVVYWPAGRRPFAPRPPERCRGRRCRNSRACRRRRCHKAGRTGVPRSVRHRTLRFRPRVIAGDMGDGVGPAIEQVRNEAVAGQLAPVETELQFGDSGEGGIVRGRVTAAGGVRASPMPSRAPDRCAAPCCRRAAGRRFGPPWAGRCR